MHGILFALIMMKPSSLGCFPPSLKEGPNRPSSHSTKKGLSAAGVFLCFSFRIDEQIRNKHVKNNTLPPSAAQPGPAVLPAEDIDKFQKEFLPRQERGGRSVEERGHGFRWSPVSGFKQRRTRKPLSQARTSESKEDEANQPLPLFQFKLCGKTRPGNYGRDPQLFSGKMDLQRRRCSSTTRQWFSADNVSLSHPNPPTQPTNPQN